MLLDLNLLCLQVSILLNVIKLAAAAAAASLVSLLNVVKLVLLLQV
jgi:ABC-type sulfate transport system permease subunit